MTGDFPPDILKLAESVVNRGYDEGLVDAVARVLWEQIEKDAEIVEAGCRVMIEPEHDEPWIIDGQDCGTIKRGARYRINGLADLASAIRSQLK